MMSSMVMFPLCWMFFTFLRSLGDSFKALMTRAAAEGTTEQVACLFWILSCTMTLRPFQSAVALAMSSPILGGKTKRTDLGGKRAGGADFATDRPQVDELHLIGVELGSHGRQMQVSGSHPM